MVPRGSLCKNRIIQQEDTSKRNPFIMKSEVADIGIRHDFTICGRYKILNWYQPVLHHPLVFG
jgi:hypothetical protein